MAENFPILNKEADYEEYKKQRISNKINLQMILTSGGLIPQIYIILNINFIQLSIKEKEKQTTESKHEEE